MEKPFALLILPPVYDFAFFDLFFKPYGLLRIGRWLEEAGWECSFLNSLDYSDPLSLETMKKPIRRYCGTGKIFRTPLEFPVQGYGFRRNFARYGITRDSLKKKVAAVRKPDMILVSTYMTYWYMGAVEAVRVCREIWPGVPVLAGGIYATLMTDHCAQAAGADHTVKGDAWEYLSGFLEKNSLPAGSAEGSGFMMADRVLSDAAVLRLNRGCPMKCSYCASSMLSSFAQGSPEAAFEELSAINRRYGTVNFAFYDDALLFRKEEVLIPFLEKVIESRLDLNFYVPNALHIDYLDSATLSLMARAGFREIRLGFESSDPDFHDRYGRKYRSETFPALAEELEKYGFAGNSLVVYVLAGLPGQYAEEAEETVMYLKQFDLRISISEYSPVPGSSLWEKSVAASSYPVAEEPLFHNNSIFPMSWERFSPADMERIKSLARK